MPGPAHDQVGTRWRPDRGHAHEGKARPRRQHFFPRNLGERKRIVDCQLDREYGPHEIGRV